MADHKTQVDGFASLQELAETIGNLRYDALAEFMGELERKLMRDSEADHRRGRFTLSSRLHEARYIIGDARVTIERIWKICEVHMPHPVVIKDITHWHEHEIHDRISKILGYDTWMLGSAWGHRDDHKMTLTLNFPKKADYDRCKDAIADAIAMEPT